MCVCVCVCVCEGGREEEREGGMEGERIEGHGGGAGNHGCVRAG